MFEWIAQKTNKTAQTVIFFLLAGAAILLAFPMLLPTLPFRWVLQLLALGFLTAAIFLTTRYVTKVYIYRVEDDGEGERDLTVTETKVGGRGRITVCRVALSHICRRELLERSDPADWKRGTKKIFDYRADLCPAKSILLVVVEGGEELTLLLSYNEELYALLLAQMESESEDGTV